MRCRVIKHAVDGVAPGGVVELADNHANRALIAGGVVEPLERLPDQPPAKPFKAAPKGDLRAAEDLQRRFDIAWEGAQEQIRSLRAELAASQADNADLRAALLAQQPAAPDAPAADAKPARARREG